MGQRVQNVQLHQLGTAPDGLRELQTGGSGPRQYLRAQHGRARRFDFSKEIPRVEAHIATLTIAPVLVPQESRQIQIRLRVRPNRQPEQLPLGSESIRRLFRRRRKGKVGGARRDGVGEEVVRGTVGCSHRCRTFCLPPSLTSPPRKQLRSERHSI